MVCHSSVWQFLMICGDMRQCDGASGKGTKIWDVGHKVSFEGTVSRYPANPTRSKLFGAIVSCYKKISLYRGFLCGHVSDAWLFSFADQRGREGLCCAIQLLVGGWRNVVRGHMLGCYQQQGGIFTWMR